MAAGRMDPRVSGDIGTMNARLTASTISLKQWDVGEVTNHWRKVIRTVNSNVVSQKICKTYGYSQVRDFRDISCVWERVAMLSMG